ncbi:MAG: hypothetical protein ACTSYI_09890 [Promethearchaeota archaeon]
MKNSAKILTFAILLSLSQGVFLPSFGSAQSLLDEPKNGPKFNYGINQGDELIYTFSSTGDLEVSDNFYTVIQNFMESELPTIYFENVASDFSFQALEADMEDLINTSVDIKLDITDIYNYDTNAEYSEDIIEGSIRLGNNEIWELPSEYLVSKIEEYKTLLQPHMNTTTYNDEIEPEIDALISDIENAAPEDFDSLTLSSHKWFENASEFLDLEAIATSNLTVFPTYPFDHYIPLGFGEVLMPMSINISSIIESVTFCYPTEFNFEDLYQYGRDLYQYAEVLTEESGEDVPVLNYTIDELLEIGSISTFHVDPQSVAIYWTLSGVDFDSLFALMNYTSGDPENNYFANVAEILIDKNNSAAAVSLALEYDENMVLASFAIYVDLAITIDGMELPTGLELDGEIVNLSFFQSIVKKEEEAPTEQQIQEGEVGDDRLSNDTSTSKIYGYSGLVVVLISVASALVLISRKKHANQDI